jgi:hypothetical protein
MTPSPDEATPLLRQRRVRRTAGLLAGGAVVAASALGIAAFSSTGEPVLAAAESAAPTSTAGPTPVVFTPATTEVLTPRQPTADEQLAAQWASWSPEEQFAFRFYVAAPEEKEQMVRFVSPPPPPPPPPPAPKPAPKPAPAPSPQPAAPSQAGHAGPGGYLACVRQKESGGRYNINTGNGYYGAYQFLPSTWNATAQRAGRADLVGVLPSNASPADQDAMAAALYASNGRQPWAGDGC